MNEKELAEVRETIAKQLLQWNVDSQYGCPQKDGSGNPIVQTSWKSEPEYLKEGYLQRADQILNTPITIEGGVCPECNGVGWWRKEKSEVGYCSKCKGKGTLPDKTFTIKEAIERMMK